MNKKIPPKLIIMVVVVAIVIIGYFSLRARSGEVYIPLKTVDMKTFLNCFIDKENFDTIISALFGKIVRGELMIFFSPTSTAERINDFLESINYSSIELQTSLNQIDTIRLTSNNWKSEEEALAAVQKIENDWKDMLSTKEKIAPIQDYEEGRYKWTIIAVFEKPLEQTTVQKMANEQNLTILEKSNLSLDKSYIPIIDGRPVFLVINVPSYREIEYLCRIKALKNPVVDYVSLNHILSLGF